MLRIGARKLTAQVAIGSLLLWAAAVPLAADTGPGRIEGLLLNVDGRPAAGYTVHLIDDEGADAAQATAGSDGIYSFGDVPAGSYAMGIETPDGALAPVTAPPVELGSRELARRDLKLVETNVATRDAALQANYGLGMWWAGLSTGGKVGVSVALAAILYGIITALDSDNETPATNF
jgi:hypothetical protein